MPVKNKSTPVHRFAEKMQQFVYSPVESEHEGHREVLNNLLYCLPDLTAFPETTRDERARDDKRLDALVSMLEERKVKAGEILRAYYEEKRQELALSNLEAPHAYQILFALSHLLDEMHRVVFAMVVDEFPRLQEIKLAETRKMLAYQLEQRPKRKQKLDQLNEELRNNADDRTQDPESHAYLHDFAKKLKVDFDRIQAEISGLERDIASLEKPPLDKPHLTNALVLFARGGYGRAEMSFASDIDTGYCLDTRGLEAAQAGVFQEMVVRMERILQLAGVNPSHQYFEIDEDLSRFTEWKTLHTIPSVLESRVLTGNPELLALLKNRFMELLPYEKFVQKKLEEFEGQAFPGFTEMNLKEDFGGLRTIQIPLWLLGGTFKAESFFTTDLLQLARKKEMLSMWETAELLSALELLNDLRNFVAEAKNTYLDSETLASGIHIQEIKNDHFSDALARVYLFRKKRFGSMDAFDSYRLRLVEGVRKIARRLLERVLDRTIEHSLQEFKVSVHLGNRRIISINPLQEGGTGEPKAIFREGNDLLKLFGYIAGSNYELSARLKDELTEVVATFRLPQNKDALREQATLFSELMCAPYAHRALATMFEIYDPLSEDTQTMIGRFFPAYNRALFLLRGVPNQKIALHQHLLQSVHQGSNGLEWLQQHFPELHASLELVDILALKWSLFLYGIGQIEGEPIGQAEAAEKAAEVLEGLGYQDLVFEKKVRLLIEHSRSLVVLSRTATYIDQAIARYFEMAERDIVNVVLLFLVNQAVLQASGFESDAEVVNLQRIFYEANQILAEIRGFPRADQSLELINLYLDHKKKDLITETRIYLLLQKTLAHGIRPTVFDPLQEAFPLEWERMEPAAKDLEIMQREIVLGNASPEEKEKLEERLFNQCRYFLSDDSIGFLTREEEGVFSWFFSAYPNRYLMASLPKYLAGQLSVFSSYKKAQVIVDIVSGDQLGAEGVMIFTRDLSRSHSRVAYAISRYRINITSGKINRVEMGEGGSGYCYYLQTTARDPGEHLSGRDLEIMILNESLPDIPQPSKRKIGPAKGVRVEFGGNDHKGYLIAEVDGKYERRNADLPHIRVVVRDEPFFFYKVSRAFDLFGVDILQTLITTTGNQVMDYFYFSQADYDKLLNSDFEEVFIQLVNSDLLSTSL